jgi:hypothetical protein
MSHDYSRKSIDCKDSPYPVMLVSSPYSFNEEHSSISLMDVLTWFKLHWKWVVLLFIVCFMIAAPIMYKQSQQVNFQQLISVPTTLSGVGLDAQRTNLYTPQSIIQSFNATYLLNWKAQTRLYVDKDFSLVSQLSPSTGSTDSSQQINVNALPDGVLLLSAVAPLDEASTISKLFNDALNAVRSIVAKKIHDLQKGNIEKIKVDQETVQALQTTLNQLTSASMSLLSKANGSNDSDQSTNIASLQAQLLTAKHTLSADQFTMASIQSDVEPVGGLLIAKPDSLWLVIAEVIGISVVIAFALALFAACVALAVRPHEAAQSQTLMK